jgi:hypothetical protein
MINKRKLNNEKNRFRHHFYDISAIDDLKTNQTLSFTKKRILSWSTKRTNATGKLLDRLLKCLR